MKGDIPSHSRDWSTPCHQDRGSPRVDTSGTRRDGWLQLQPGELRVYIVHPIESHHRLNHRTHACTFLSGTKVSGPIFDWTISLTRPQTPYRLTSLRCQNPRSHTRERLTYVEFPVPVHVPTLFTIETRDLHVIVDEDLAFFTRGFKRRVPKVPFFYRQQRSHSFLQSQETLRPVSPGVPEGRVPTLTIIDWKRKQNSVGGL